MVDSKTSARPGVARTILITGASGFVGSYAVPYFESRGYTVREFRRPGDMRNLEDLRAATRGADWVLHLAGAKNDEAESEAINVGGARNLITACRKNSVRRIVNVSTLSAQLPNPGTYGKTKRAADELFAAAPVPVATLRPSVIYGQRPEGVLGSIVSFSKLPAMPIIGNGSTPFWPLHVADLLQACEQALYKTKPGIYEVVGPEEISFTTLTEKISTAVQGKRRRALYLPAPIALFIARAGTALFGRFPITESNVRGATQSPSRNPRRTIVTAKKVDAGIAELAELLKSEAWRKLTTVARYGSPRSRITERELDMYNSLKNKCPAEHRERLAAAIIEASPASAPWLLQKERSYFEIIRSVSRILFGYVSGV